MTKLSNVLFSHGARVLIFLSIRLEAVELVNEVPSGSIIGAQSLLQRPEGIAFTPDGNYVAIANAAANNILFFLTSTCSTLNNSGPPAFILNSSNTSLSYPHDIDFSPNGSHLAVASGDSNRVTIHQKNEDDGYYSQTPLAILNGSDASVIAVNAVKYSPTGKCLAVCDLQGHKILLYRYQDDNYELLPYQVIQDSIETLDRPDGVAFSSDGSLLVVTSHGTHSVLIYERLADTEEHYTSTPVEMIKGVETCFCFTHSVSFHPLDDTLAVSSAGGRKTLALFTKTSQTAPYYGSTPSQIIEVYNPETIHLQINANEEGGVKGISFSRDGEILGICASDIADPSRAILFFPIRTIDFICN